MLGLRAKPVWDGDGFDYDGIPVTVVPCPSVLAIWEAIESRDDSQWTVVLTSIEDDELGDTVLAHLVDGRLITPDPWDALRSNFSASTIEPSLYRSTNDRALANGLLALLSGRGYSPPRSAHPGSRHVGAGPRRPPDRQEPPTWRSTGRPYWSGADRITPSTASFGSSQKAVPGSPRAFRHWLTGRSGRLAKPLSALLGRNRIPDLLPLGCRRAVRR